jgi:hypothetical protein
VIETSTGHVWRLDPNFDQVLRKACARQLSVDWAGHFPSVTPPRLCP